MPKKGIDRAELTHAFNFGTHRTRRPFPTQGAEAIAESYARLSHRLEMGELYKKNCTQRFRR